MSAKRRVLSWVLLTGLVVSAGLVVALNASAPSNTVVKGKARFISGFLPDVRDPMGYPLPNKIVNDDPALYYENVGNNIIEIMDSSKQGKCIYLTLVTDQMSSRFVNLYLDSVVSGPGQNLPTACAKPYFIYPQIIAPIGTAKLHMKVAGEWEKISDPSDPYGIDTLSPKAGELNFLTMTDGQEAYVYIGRFYFDAPDLKSTRKIDESRMDLWFADCQWAKIKASGWDGGMVNTWTLSPVVEPFKHKAWDGSGTWCYHPEGAIPYMVYSNASLSCNHGIYRMPWELEITRLQ